MQRLYIDLDTHPRYARAGITGLQLASITAILGDPLDVEVVFHNSGEIATLDDDSPGVLTVKPFDSPDGDALFSDITMVKTAITEPAGFSYNFAGVLDSDEIIAHIGKLASIDLHCAIAWTEPGEQERRCADFVFTFLNSSIRPADTLPASASRVDVTNEKIRILCPDGSWRYATLFNES